MKNRKKSLQERVIEQEIKGLEKELYRLEGIHPETPNELALSKYVEYVPVNSGPEYLKVHGSIWSKPFLSVEGINVKSLEEARIMASKRGLKGICVTFGA